MTSTGFIGVVVDPDNLPSDYAPDGTFVRLSTDRKGRLLISGESTVIITGSSEPGDDLPNPDTNVPVTAYNEYWDPIAGGWYRVAAIDINNESIPASPTPFYTLATYSVCGGLDAETSIYSTFCQREASDDMPNPTAATSSLLPLDTLSRNLLYCPESGGGQWGMMRGDRALNTVTIAGLPPPSDNGRSPTSVGAAGSNLQRGRLQSGISRILSLYVSMNAGTDQWLMFFDQNTTTPANGSTPIPGLVFFVPADGGFAFQVGREHFSEQGLCLTNGLAWAISTTATTLTLGSEFSGSISATLAT